MDILGIDAAHRYVTRSIEFGVLEPTDMNIYVGMKGGWYAHKLMGTVHFYIEEDKNAHWYFEVRTSSGWSGSARYNGTSFEKSPPIGGAWPEYELGSASWSCDDAILLSFMVGLELDY